MRTNVQTETVENRPEESLAFVLSDVARLMRRNFNRRVQALDLTQVQWRALAYIKRHEGMKQGQLADILEVQPISVGRLIDRMEAAGWVERRPDLNDRRAINLYLTEKSLPILKELEQQSHALWDVAGAGLSQEDQDAMMGHLLVIRKNLINEEI